MTERKIDVIFNYDTQSYENAQGTVLEEQDGWDFPCNLCRGPAKFRGFTSQHELYDCLNCGHLVKVC